MEEIPHGRMRRNWKIDAQTQVYVDPLVVVVVEAGGSRGARGGRGAEFSIKLSFIG